MRRLLIINPTAGQFRNELLGINFTKYHFSRRTEYVTPKSVEETTKIAANVARERSHDVIYVYGGDGTVNQIASSIIDATPGATCNERPAIGIIPAGTCNVLAGELGITESNVGDLTRPKPRANLRCLDIGSAGNRYFLLMAGYGIDGEAVRNVSLPAKGILGASAYAISALSALVSHKPSRAKITIDSETVNVETSLVLIANAQSYGLNQIKIAPEASLDDGWLDICIFEHDVLAPQNLISSVAKAMGSKDGRHPDIRYFRGRTITIAADPPMPGQLDGDAWGETPVTAKILPNALNFLVPRPAV